MTKENFSHCRAVIVDLDRTLLRTDKSLSSRNIRALQKCRDLGLKIMVATARPHRCMLEYSEKIPFDAYTVTNGAIILGQGQKIIHPISATSAKKVLATLCAVPGLLISVEMGNDVYSNLPIPDYESILYDDFPNIPPGEEIYKILVNFESDHVLEMVKRHLPDDLYCTVSGGHLIQIMSKDAGKWQGIQAMLALWDIAAENALYFGDDQDDIKPLQNCGMGVAMENAIPEAKMAADDIAGSNDADGVAAWLEAFFGF